MWIQKRKTNMIIYLYGGLVLVASIMLFLGWQQFQKTQTLVNYGNLAKATVYGYDVNSDSDGTTYAPKFEYTDHNKETKRFQSSVHSSPKPYHVGAKVDILYDPYHVIEAKVVGYWGLYRATILLCAIAAPMLVIGLGYFLFTGFRF